MSNTPLLLGLAVGFSIAVPIGPMGILCIQRTLASGMRVGLCTGLGAATVNIAYGAAVVLGMESAAPWMERAGRVLSIAAGIVLLLMAARMLMRRHVAEDAPGQAPRSCASAYLSALAFNAANPMSLLLIFALLSPIAGTTAASPAAASALLFGMFAAASLWWMLLSGGVALLRSRLRPELLLHANLAAGMLLTAYGTLALARVN